MRTRVGAMAAVGLLLVGLLAASSVGAVSPDSGGQPAVQMAESDTWNETYTPGPEAGTFIDALAVEGGGYLLVGRFGSEDGGDSNALAMRVDGTGDLEWVWSLGGYGDTSLAGAVQVDDDLYLVAGTRRTPDRGAERFVAALTDDGELAWRDTYGEGRVTDAVRVPNGGALLVGGETASTITPNGAEIWTVDYEDTDLEAAARIDDGYVLAGANTSGSRPAREVRRIDGTGEVVWIETGGGAGPERYTGVTVVQDSIHAVGRATLGDPEGSGAARNPAVGVYHSNGSLEHGSVTRKETTNESVTDVAPAEVGVVTAVRRDTGGRLMRFAKGDVIRTRPVDARLRSVTAVGDGRYLVTGDQAGEAYAAVVEPAFEAPVQQSSSDDSGSGAGQAGSGDGNGDRESPADGSDGGFGAPTLPSVPLGGVPSSVTIVLVAAAAIASLAAVAVTLLALRDL